MFATLNTVHEPSDWLGKIKYNLLPPPVRVERISPEGGSDFLRLQVPIVRGKIHWKTVESAAAGAGQALLPEHALQLPARVHLKAFESTRFREIVSVNSFLKLLSLLKSDTMLAACAVVDVQGHYASTLSSLPRYCRSIRIITRREEAYEPFCAHCLREYGCAVQIGSDISKAFDAPVVLLCREAERPTAFSARSIVFAPAGERLFAARLLTPEGISLPGKYLDLMPGGIDPMLFAAALYEISGIFSIARCVCPAFRYRAQILSYGEVISMLD